MANYYLRVTFSEIALVHTNPVLWTCVEFSSCSYWQVSTKIAWSLPAHTLATFFESEKCDSGGEFHYTSDRVYTAGSITPNSTSFRSMMVSNTLHPQPTIKHVNNCPSEDASVDDLTVDSTASSVGAVVAGEDLAVDGGLSSNWNDTLDGF
jgi:hypothetical protein